MLHPLFFCRLDEIVDDAGISQIVIDPNPLPEGVIYKVMYYSQVDVYTLVGCRRGGEDEYATGENLWRGTVPIAASGGALTLYSEPVPTPGTPSLEEMSVWSRVDSTIGTYGVPMNVAIALRDPKNIVYF